MMMTDEKNDNRKKTKQSTPVTIFPTKKTCSTLNNSVVESSEQKKSQFVHNLVKMNIFKKQQQTRNK